MPVHNPRRYEYRRDLPHLQNGRKTLFVTMSAVCFLPPDARSIVMEHIRRENGSQAWIHCAVVMPTHVHMLLSPKLDPADQVYTIAEILDGMRGASAHRINRLLNRKGRLWQDEYFDRLVRDGEFQKYVDYICRNPEKVGLVAQEEDYPWLWVDPQV